MKILSIETSCDETAVSIVEASGGLESPLFKVLGDALFSQISIHREYGGVYPMLAKREHAKNLSPLLAKAMKDAGLYKESKTKYSLELWNEIETILFREEGLYPEFKKTFGNTEKPDFDYIAVTKGPGLEPALWVGISFAIALGKLWDMPVVGINHMEGHVASVLIENTDTRKLEFPALAVLISGGHTEIVKVSNWGKYKVIGETVDDAVGEAFDKTARLLGLPYPGGPEISKLAQKSREEKIEHRVKLPRPMIHSHNLNFSFAGLKTAVLYYIRDNFSGNNENMSENEKSDLAREFEDSVIDVMKNKTNEALIENNVKTLIVAGGVIANKALKEVFMEFEKTFPGVVVKIPTRNLATDNSLMIAAASYINVCLKPEILRNPQKIAANGNLRFE